MNPSHKPPSRKPASRLEDQARTVAALAGLGSKLIETHISWVLLREDVAYKIKKSLRLDFLDFTELDRRRFYCEEEVRLNSRLAPQIYLDVVPVGGTPDAPELGRKPAIEWAVRMTRFDVNDEMDSRLLRGTLLAAHVDSLAEVLARFHRGLPPAARDAPYGDPHFVHESAMRNLSELDAILMNGKKGSAAASLMQATEEAFRAHLACFERRRDEGWVRECHGDLHLANIVLIGDEAVPFDGIEFDPALRWIDVMADLSFPFMDLIRFGRTDLAYRLLTRYLEETGDYGGVELLPYYASGRAAVRAKVHALRAAQPSAVSDNRAEAPAASRAYLDVAERLLATRRPALIVTCGLPGSGKSTFALAATERLGAIRIRSDVERKRLFGLSALEASRERAGDIYGADAGARTYQALRDVAGKLLAAGFSVIVDAAFLKQDERRSFRRLADGMDVPFAIAFLQAPEAVLRARVAARMQQGKDPSEADLGVLAFLQGVHEPLQPAEISRAVEFMNDGESGFTADDQTWTRLERLLSS